MEAWPWVHIGREGGGKGRTIDRACAQAMRAIEQHLPDGITLGSDANGHGPKGSQTRG